ncbi:MAG: arylsulfatase, partial [Planctomycetaceae bacterium]|nr:arylsulfatase [Planctomycetaceae bacterium]
PNLDRLAKGGVRLTQFYTTGRCCPSRASLLTGYYSHRVGLGHMTKDIGQPGYRGRVSKDAKTIAQRLNKAGYRSFLSGKWHLGTDDPTQHGFEEFYGTLVSAKTFWEPDHFLRLPKDRTARHYDKDKFYGTDALADHALDFLNQAHETPGKPWFLYLAFNAPHFPLHAPKETIAEYAERYQKGWDQLRGQRLARMKRLGIVPEDIQLTPRSPYYDWGESAGIDNPEWNSLPDDRRTDLARRMAIYAAMVHRMDENIGRVLAELERNKELENTLILFTSDNGACAEWNPYGFDIKSGPQNILHRGEQLETMGTPGTFHSVGSGWANASNTPWRMYKHYNHEGGIAVPCIIHWPNGMHTAAGTINPTPAHLIDIVPTLMEAGKKSNPSVTSSQSKSAMPSLPGVNLLPILRNETLPKRRLFFEHEGHRAVRDGRWKLVALRGKPWELYDTTTDRTELHDLTSKHTDIAHRMEEAWNQWAVRNHVTPLPKDYGVEGVPTADKTTRTNK